MDISGARDKQFISRLEDLTPASILNRVIARAIDFLIVFALFETIPRAGFFAGIAYLLIADGLFKGRSIGKRVVGLRVVFVDIFDDVKDCTFKESILRNSPFAAAVILYKIIGVIPLLGWIFSFLIVAGVLLFESLVMMGSDMGMRLGDELAKTLVIDDEQGRIGV